MVLNPDVDGYTKTLYHRKILQKTQKTTVLKTIRKLKPKHKLWVPNFYIKLARRGDSSLLLPRQLRRCHATFISLVNALLHRTLHSRPRPVLLQSRYNAHVCVWIGRAETTRRALRGILLHVTKQRLLTPNVGV